MEKTFSRAETLNVEIFENSSDTASNCQRPNLYIIPVTKVFNTTDNTHQLPQCIVENVKKDISEITNSNFIIVIEGLSNFSIAEIQGNFTLFDKVQLMKTELKIEKPLRGKILWEFSSKQKSNNHSIKVDFTIDHLCLKTVIFNSDGVSRNQPDLEVNVDVGKVQFKTPLLDVIENEEKFSQCIRSIMAESVSNSSKEAIKLEFGLNERV